MTSLNHLFVRLVAATTLFTALCGASFAQAPRGPSTPEERARVEQVAEAARRDPQAAFGAQGAWLEKWVNDVPDFMFRPEGVAKWTIKAAHPEMKDTLRFAYTAGALAYQVKHNIADAKEPVQLMAIDSAALNTALDAYQALAAKNPQQRSPRLDSALARRAKGELAALVTELAK